MNQHSVESSRRSERFVDGYGHRFSRSPMGAMASVFRAVEAAFDVGHDALCARTRGRHDVAFARQAGMYLARVALGLTFSDAGKLFGRDRTTAAHACRIVEDLRDDPTFDALLLKMERDILSAETQTRRVQG